MAAEGSALSVYFLDVGQGDCTFIVPPEGEGDPIMFDCPDPYVAERYTRLCGSECKENVKRHDFPCQLGSDGPSSNRRLASNLSALGSITLTPERPHHELYPLHWARREACLCYIHH